ncbi:MAG: hypothetical protein ABJC04_11005, partial [Verrucomicrobiota bacterium]
PPGTVADVALAEDLKRDGIEIPKESKETSSTRLPLKGEAICGTPPSTKSLLAKNEINGRIKAH